jgi:AraC-like DNA-binding protein
MENGIGFEKTNPATTSRLRSECVGTSMATLTTHFKDVTRMTFQALLADKLQYQVQLAMILTKYTATRATCTPQ